MPPQEQALLQADLDKLATLNRWLARQGIVDDVIAERERQHAQWGSPDIPLGTSRETWAATEAHLREVCNTKLADGTVTFLDVLLEEVFEFAAEEDPAKARDELVQVLAVGVQIIEAIDRRAAGSG